jgi:cell wall-associated NlpC family hydrolase
MPTFREYSDIPYIKNGNSFDGCDCYGLVWLWYKHELGIVLPSHQGARDEHGVEFVAPMVTDLHKYFSPVDGALKRGDVTYMYLDGDAHCGVMINDQRFIHASSKRGIIVTRYSDWKRRIVKAYRHKDLA